MIQTLRPHARRLVLALGLLVVVVGLLWFVWLPHYRPSLEPGERYGIDVSHHQGPIDWTRVAADDISFAYIKATEGADHRDTRFHENWRGAAEAGLDRGAYHYFTLCRPGEEQARNFLGVVPFDGEALPPAVDLELAGNCRARPPVDALRRELETFLDLVESGWGSPMLLYVGRDFDELYGVKAWGGRPLWELRFLRRPSDHEWLVWQVMGFGRVQGIEGPVDLDVMHPGRR